MKKYILYFLVLLISLLQLSSCSSEPSGIALPDQPVQEEAPSQPEAEKDEERTDEEIAVNSSENNTDFPPVEQAAHTEDLVFIDFLSGAFSQGYSVMADYTEKDIAIGEALRTQSFFTFVINQAQDDISILDAKGMKKDCLFSDALNPTATTVHIPNYSENDVLVLRDEKRIPLKEFLPTQITEGFSEINEEVEIEYLQKIYRIKRIAIDYPFTGYCVIDFDSNAGDPAEMLEYLGIYNADLQGNPDTHEVAGHPSKELAYELRGHTVYVRGYNGRAKLFFKQRTGHTVFEVNAPVN